MAEQYNFEGLSKDIKLDPFRGLEKKRPELTLKRLARTPGEALKHTGRSMIRSFRTHFEAGGWDEFKAAAEVDFGGIDKMAAAMIEDRPELGVKVQEKIDAGMDESAARIETAREFYEQRKARIAQRIKDVEEAEFLETAPEFRGPSSGFIEDAAAGLFGSLPSMGALAVSPVLGVPAIYMHMQGALHEQIEQEAKAKGVEVSSERLLKLSQRGAAVMTPMELVGDLLQIKAAMGSGVFTKHLSEIALAMGGEGFVEFAQKYPEEFAVRVALNPDLDSDEIADLMYDTVTDLSVFEEALYEGAVGAVAGGTVAGAGKVAVNAIDSLVSPKQKEINRQKREKIREYMQAEELSADEKRDFLRTVGIPVEEAATEEQVADIVDQVKTRILFQAEPIVSQEKNALIDSIERSKIKPEHRDLAFAMWDGIARKAAEEELIRRPEDFYKEWLADVRRQPFEEFVDEQGVSYQGGRINLNENFNRWFEDSKATVDFKSGSEPRIFYHGTRSAEDFNYFDPARAHEYGGETGFFFSQLPALAEAYTKDISGDPQKGRIVPVYLKAENPLVADFAGAGFDPDRIGYYIRQAKRGGHDSLILRNIRDEGIVDNQWVVFDNKQIKSVFNRGAWDPATDRIMYQTAAGPEIEGERIVFQQRRGERFEAKLPQTVEEFKNWEFYVPEGGASKTPKTVFSWDRADYETLADIAKSDEFRLDESLGAHYPSEVPKTLHLKSKIKNGEPLKIFRAAPKNQGIIPGSYVSESKAYVQFHGENIIQQTEDWIIHEETVFPDELMTYGDPHEFIYIPRTPELGFKRFQKQIKKGAIEPGREAIFQEKRGAISNLFDLTPKIIHLFEGADPSTLIHETGHLITAMMYQAGHADYLTAAKWAGVDEARARKGLDSWTEAELEKFAKGFERYMMEGKAPTMAMAKVFAKIKSMLVELYKHIKNEYFRDVKLTDEMRALFDRWVESERMRQLDPFFDVADWYRADDVSAAEADRIAAELSKLAAQPREAFSIEYDEIVEKARKMVAGRMAEKKRRMEAELDKQFRAEATRSIEDDPFYQMLDDIMASGGLRSDMINTFYDRSWVAELIRKRPGILSKHGIQPDIIGAQYGYDTIDAMLTDIINRPTKAQAIEHYYQDMWREYEAVEHLSQADTYAEALETEVEIINELLAKRKPAARRDLKKVIRQKTGQQRTEDSRQLAADLKRDEQVARAAWNEAKKAAIAETKEKLSEQNKERLARLREQHLERIVTLKEAHLKRVKRLRQNYKDRALKEKVHKRVARIIRQKTMIPEFKAQIVNFLSQYYKIPKTWAMDIPSVPLTEFIADLEAEGEQISAVLQLLEKAPPPKSKGKLSAEEAEVIGEIVNGLAHLERSARNQMLINQKKQIQDVVNSNIAAIVKSHKPTGEAKHPVEAGRDPTFFQQLSESSKKFFAEIQKPEFILRALDGFEDFGPNHSSIFGEIKSAEDAELTLGEEFTAKLEQIFDGFGREWAGKKYKISGIPSMVTKEEMIMVLLNSGNEGNRAALKAGNDIDEDQINEIIDKLTNEEIDLVYKIWRLIDSLFPKLNEVHKKLTGVNLKKVDGYYFPMVFNRRLSWTAGKFDQERAERNLFANQYMRPKVEAGHRIERRGGKMGLKLSFDVISGHIGKVIHDITHQIPVRNAQRIIAHPDYREAIRQIVGPSTYAQLTPWLANIASPRMEPQTALEKLLGRLRRNTTTVALGVKLSVAAKQLLSLTQTMDELGMVQTVRGLREFYKNPQAAKRFVNELSPAMRQRRTAWDRELRQFYKGFSPKHFKGWEWMREAYFALISLMDSLATYPSWLAAYQAEIEKSGDQIRAINYADMVVRITQPAARPKDLAEIQRGGEIRKLLTMFYTFFSVFQNRMMAAHSKARMGRMNMAQLVRSYWYMMIMPAILGSAINEREWPKDPQTILKAIFTYGLGGIPFIRDVANGIVSVYDYTFSPVVGGPQEVQRFARAVTAEDPDAQRIAKRSIMLAGYLAGLPSAQVNVTMDGLIDMIEGKTSNPVNLLFREKKK